MASSTSQVQSFHDIRIEGQQNSLVINQIIQISVEAIKQQTLITSSPYLGLRRFDGKHHQFFFGRDEFVARLLRSLPQLSLLAVLGPSGSGKSSVVRAGLIPQLDERMPKGRFHAITFAPDRDPFLSLRSGLNEGAGISFGRTDFIRPSPQALLEMVAELRVEDEQWLLFIDQFEEVFTLCSDERLRAAFLDALTQLARTEQSAVKIVLSMRADFLGQLAPYPELAALVEQGIHLLTDLSQSGLRAAIEQPAARHGVVFEEGLVEQIIKDVQQRPGTLPLLQYTLDLLWKTDDDLNDRTLNTVTYHRLGGVEGALRDQAEELYSFTRQGNKKAVREPAQKDRMRRIFLRLIDYRGDVEPHPVSKRAAHADFTLPQEQAILKELIDSKLLISSSEVRVNEGEAQGMLSLGPATVELAHEALIGAWPRLSEWLKQTREVLSIFHRLREDAKRWKDAATRNPRQAESELWSGSRLEQAVELRQQGEFSRLLSGLSESESSFLDAGAELHERRSLEEDERRLRKLQALQRELDEFIERGRLLLLAGEPIEAAVWLFGAHERGSQNPMLPYLLRQAMLHVERVHAVLLGHKGPILSIEYSPDGRRLVTASADGTARIWDAQTGASLFELRGHQGTVRRASFDPSSKRVLSAGEDGTARLWDAASGTLLKLFGEHGGSVMAAEFHPNGQSVLTADESAVLRLWDTASGLSCKQLSGHVGPIHCACFSPDGSLILSAGADGLVRLWSAASGELSAALAGNGSAITAAGFSPDGSKIVAIAEDRSVRFWHTHTRTQWQSLLPASEFHDDRIRGFAFSPDGEWFATGSDDCTAGLLTLYCYDNRVPTYNRLSGHHSCVTYVAFSPEGDYHCTASDDGTVKLWRGSCLATLRGPTRGATQARFSLDGRYVAASAMDGTAWLWSVFTPELSAELGRATESISGFELSPDSRLLATWGFAGDPEGGQAVVHVFELDGTRCLRTIPAKEEAPGSTEVASAQFSHDGGLLTVVLRPNTVLFFSASDLRQIGKLLTTSEILQVSISPDGCYALTLEQDNRLCAWEARAGRMLWAVHHRGSSVQHASFTPDGCHVLTATASGVVWLLHPMTGARQATFRQPAEGMLSVAYSADGARVLFHNNHFANHYGRHNFEVDFSVWELRESLRHRSSKKLPKSAEMRFDPTGRSVACCEPKSTVVKIYDAETWSLRTQIEGLSGAIQDLQFSPDGARIAIAVADVRIFDTMTGTLLMRLELSACKALRFTPDGQQLLAQRFTKSLCICIINVGAERRTSSTLTEILRSRVPYRLQGVMTVPAELTALRHQASDSREPALHYSHRLDCLWHAVYALAHHKPADAQARVEASAAVLPAFCDPEGTAMQKLTELAIPRSQGQAADQEHVLRSILLMLARELPDHERRASALQDAGNLALQHLGKPQLAIRMYEESLHLRKDEDSSAEIRAALFAAHLCAGHYATVLSSVKDFVEADHSHYIDKRSTEIMPIFGWLAFVLQAKEIVINNWSLKASKIFYHEFSELKLFRRAIFAIHKYIPYGDLSIRDAAQVVSILDISLQDSVSEENKQLCLSILEGRESIRQRIAVRDFAGILTDAEVWWPHMSQLSGGLDLIWMTVFWSLALQLEDADKGLIWSNRIFELCDGSQIPRFACLWFIEALSEQAATLKRWQTIRRVFELFDGPINFPENRRELYSLLSDSIS